MPILGASIGTLNDIYVYIYILISIYIRIHVPYIFGLAVEARVQPNSSGWVHIRRYNNGFIYDGETFDKFFLSRLCLIIN